MQRLSAKITSKGQVTLPAKLRDRLGLKPGDRIDFVEGKRGNVEIVARRKTIQDLLNNSDIVIDRRELVTQALADYGTGPADFADYFIGRDNGSSGCRTTVTFDKEAGCHPAFTLLQP